MGLGLTWRRVLGLTPREQEALRNVWERNGRMQMGMFYQIRADIHNSSENLNREDKRRWTAQDFGAEAPAQQDPRRKFTRDEADRMVRGAFGGRLDDKEGKPVSALKGLKGQNLPSALQAKIKVVEVRAPQPRTRNLRVARGPGK